MNKSALNSVRYCFWHPSFQMLFLLINTVSFQLRKRSSEIILDSLTIGSMKPESLRVTLNKEVEL